MKYCFTDCVPVFMRWCRHLFIQDLFLFFISETFSSCEEKLFQGRDSTCGSTVLMFHPLKIYQIKAEVLHWCRTSPSLLSQSNWAQWAGNLSLIQPYLIVESAHICLLSLLKYYLLCLPPSLSVTWMVYCFPRRQLIFSFDRSGIYHLKGFLQYIPKLIPSVCPSICTTVF